MRRSVPGLLGHLPTRASVHIRQQSEQKRPRLPARLHPPKPARGRREPGVELRQPPIGIYAVPSGRRSIFGCLHKSLIIARRPRADPRPPHRAPAPAASPDLNVKARPGRAADATHRTRCRRDRQARTKPSRPPRSDYPWCARRPAPPAAPPRHRDQAHAGPNASGSWLPSAPQPAATTTHAVPTSG